ncbi:SusC/RagA family TonB-linked outer membrane protein [Pedobacter duraquae]|uniref:TonB-linked SusC/RagA family outer membrane protein n=1 Tax=Pedobacter duraquae TaxID=425511 RepID=A0A4R6IPM8_9SPHI|nr:TonB-dependent receptor [Pedobacter duraquae]TDO24223.1 TonB-linked SusC/RagA family outer membrane protein [Pedobacter duraquae]
MVILKPRNAPHRLVNAGLYASGLLCILLAAGNAKAAAVTKHAIPNPTVKSSSQKLAELTIEGTVKDAAGLPMPGVSILLKGTKNAAMTDPAGRFKIVVPDGTGTLVFSYIGYANREVPINNQTRINIVLAEDSKVLNDVVIIGYGTVKKRDLTGSVSSVKGEDLKNVPAQNVMESIQGKIPGADITRSSGQTGSGVNITLRGNRSLAGSNAPLFVVDGAIYYGNIADIATSDVQSIDVLKDASSTAIYGSRGANGVIIITTKRGANGSTTVSANSYVGVSDVSRVPTLATGPEYVAWKREANRAAGRWTSTANDPAIFNPTEIAAIASNTWTDYHDLLIHSGLQQDHQFSVTSGTEKTKIYFSGDFYKEKGVFKLDDLSRYSARMNVDQTISKIFKAGIQAQIVYYKQHLRGDPLNAANKMIPLGSAFDANGNFLLQPIPGGAFSPLSDEQPGVYAGEGRNNRSFGTIYAELTPLAGLSIRSNFTANLFNTRTGYYYGVNSLNRGGSAARSQYNTSGSTDLLFETIVNYNKTIGDHSLTLTAIGGLQNRTADSGSAQGDGQLLGSQIFYGLGGATSGLISNTAYSRQDILSVAGRVNYSYKSKYLLTLTGRNDGSSKLTEGSKWTFFPSAAAAWRVSEESFLKDNKTISDLKFRVSYGVAGNDPYEPYVTQSVLTRNPYSFGEVLAPGYAYSTQIGNPDLRWEKSSTIDLGLDFGFLNNRLTGTVDVYNTNTNDLLLPRRLPASSGVSTTVQNVGKTNNKGIELSLTSANVQGKDWTWSTTVTFTKNKEKIKELVTEGVNDIASGLFLGQPIQVYYDYEKLGIWQTSEAAEAAKFGQLPGSIRVKDQNGDGKIDATNDRIVLGTSRPKWSGGIDNTVRYKNFDFNVYVFARIGQMIAPDFLGVKTNYGENTAAAGLNYWTPENPSGIYPRPNANGGFLYTSTMNYTNGSFVRIRDITLGYTLPKTLFGGAFKSFRIYANAKNYFTFSKDRIKEYDPERGGSENFPMTKLMTAGINATF